MEINKKDQTYTMKRWINGNTEVITRKYYTQKDFEESEFVKILLEARKMWNEEVLKYGEDYGSCILGDCIKVPFLRPRCRNISYATIVASPSVQGSITKEVTVKPILEFLKNNGINCFYHEGHMD